VENPQAVCLKSVDSIDCSHERCGVYSSSQVLLWQLVAQVVLREEQLVSCVYVAQSRLVCVKGGGAQAE